jgi:serine-type D-Ala-D-Ala carboxypeptidase/endopeptidase
MKVTVRQGITGVVFCVLLPATTAAQHFPSDAELTSLIQTRVDDGRAIGIALGVLEADGSSRVVTAGDAGRNARALSELSVFEIGSITKAFTGILLADMVRRGEVTLSDAVSAHLPDAVVVPSRGGREITLLDLATHHSGLPREPGNMSPADPSNPFADYTVEQLYAFLSEHELARDIGEAYEYSNLGFGLLGHALARTVGMSYEELVRERILEPLGMDMSGIGLDSAMQAWMADGHHQIGTVVPLFDLPTLAGAGALRSNVRDMLRFLAANVGEPETELERGMRDAYTVREQLTGQVSIGLGWRIQSVGNSKIVRHSGGTTGFRTFIGFDPDREVGVVLLTNSAHETDDIGLHLINNELPLWVEQTEIEVATEILDDYVGEYQFTPERSITVTLEGDALFVHATGRRRLQLFAESETEFFVRRANLQITFERDDDGEVTGLVLHAGGQDMPGRKVQ